MLDDGVWVCMCWEEVHVAWHWDCDGDWDWLTTEQERFGVANSVASDRIVESAGEGRADTGAGEGEGAGTFFTRRRFALCFKIGAHGICANERFRARFLGRVMDVGVHSTSAVLGVLVYTWAASVCRLGGVGVHRCRGSTPEEEGEEDGVVCGGGVDGTRPICEKGP